MISRAETARTAEAVQDRLGHDHVSALEFLGLLRWKDAPLLDVVEPYRRTIFASVLDTVDADGQPVYNLALLGRGKKNWKTFDEIAAALYSLVANDYPSGNQAYLFAADEGQAGDGLALAKLIIAANPLLQERLVIRQKVVERRDGRGFLMILPAQDTAGAHGKTYCFCGIDEIHTHRTWDLLEAMQHDPHRPEALMWITSYASIYHKPGVPLFDLMQQGRAGTDPRMFFSWYAADFTTDPDFAAADPETRANPSRASWASSGYLDQQRRRLPAHKFRRLHLNLPGLPEGSAFQPEPVMAAFDRGVTDRPPVAGVVYRGVTDMSGGSNDDATLAIGHVDAEGRVVVDLVMNQGPPPPFDPRQAVARFARRLAEYRITRVTGDKYAGETFIADFAAHGITYDVATAPASQLYEALEPVLNAGELRLPDAPTLESQLLGLLWRGGKIDHLPGEHDDWANAVAGVVRLLTTRGATVSAAAVQAWAASMDSFTRASYWLNTEQGGITQ
jgi:hypothetical protein